MSAYRTVVVGTDGSDSSLRAVERAGEIAAGAGAKLIVATAYFPQSEDHHAADVLKDEATRRPATPPLSTRSSRKRAIARRSRARRISRRRRSSGGHPSMPWSTWPMIPERICWWSATSVFRPSRAGFWARCPRTWHVGRRSTCSSCTRPDITSEGPAHCGVPGFLHLRPLMDFTKVR